MNFNFYTASPIVCLDVWGFDFSQTRKQGKPRENTVLP